MSRVMLGDESPAAATGHAGEYAAVEEVPTIHSDGCADRLARRFQLFCAAKCCFNQSGCIVPSLVRQSPSQGFYTGEWSVLGQDTVTDSRLIL
jgi:hypothetical protein